MNDVITDLTDKSGVILYLSSCQQVPREHFSDFTPSCSPFGPNKDIFNQKYILLFEVPH